MTVEIIVSKAPDKSILELFDQLINVFGCQHRSFSISGVNVTTPPQELRDQRGTSRAITSVHFSPQEPTFSVTFSRNHQGSPYYDLLVINANQNGVSPATVEVMLQLNQIISEHLRIPDQSSSLSSKQALGVVEKEISALADLHRTFLDDAQQLRARYEEEDIERRTRFANEMNSERERIANIESETLRNISSKQSELDEKIKQFDLSDHMRARRLQRAEITNQIQTFLKGSPKTKSSAFTQLIISLLCILGFSISGFFSFESFQSFISKTEQNVTNNTTAGITDSVKIGNIIQAPSDGLQKTVEEPRSAMSQASTPDYVLWLMAVRGAILSAVAIGFIVYLLGFLRRNHDEEVRHFQELQRYGMDINRASWVIETAMEMTSKENATLPEAWLHGACSGLFQSGRQKDAEVNSLSALGAVMGLGPDLEVSPNGAKLSFSGKAAKAAAKEGAS